MANWFSFSNTPPSLQPVTIPTPTFSIASLPQWVSPPPVNLPAPSARQGGLYNFSFNSIPYQDLQLPPAQNVTSSNLPAQIPRTNYSANTNTNSNIIPSRDWAVMPNGKNTQLIARHSGQTIDLPTNQAEYAAIPESAKQALRDYSSKYSPGGLYGSSPFGYFRDEFGNVSWNKIGSTALQGLQALSIPLQVWNAFQENSLAERQIKNAEHIARLNYDAQKKFYEENKARGSGGSLALSGNYSKQGLVKAKQHDKDTTLKEFDRV